MPSSNIVVAHAETGLVTAEVLRADRISPGFVSRSTSSRGCACKRREAARLR